MKIITSKDNPAYKNALRLTRKKGRDETGMYLIEGVKPLEDAAGMGIRVRSVFIREGTEDIPKALVKEASALGKKLFDRLSSTETSQGVIAVAEKRVHDAASFAAEAADGNLLVLDRVQDPGNIGTMIRTAEAAGYSGVISVTGSGDVYSPKVVRAAAGSLFRVPEISMGAEAALRLIAETGRRLIAACPDDAEDCFEADMSGDIALVIGNEGNGVGDMFKEAARLRVKIPMTGSIESLNAAVAAGILMYRSRRINK